MISTTQYIRKPLYVDAVRITGANFDEIAAWCQGEVQSDEVPGKGTTKKYIKVRVHNPKNARQTKAFVGDWILYTERGYKVYTNRAFRASFDEMQSQTETLDAPVAVVPPLEAEVPVLMAAPEGVVEQPENVETVVQQEPIEPAAAEGKRVLSIQEQKELTADEVRELVQSGEAVLAQDIAAA